MRIESDLKSVTDMKTKTAELLRSLNESRRPIVITHRGEPKGVLMDVENYQELRRAALLLRLVGQGEADLGRGRTVGQNRVFGQLRARVAKASNERRRFRTDCG